MSPTQRGFYILELQRVKKVENYAGAVESIRVHKTQVYATLSRVSIRGIPFTHHHTIPLMLTAPPKKRKLPEGQTCTVPVNSKSTVEFSEYSNTQPFSEPASYESR